MPDQIATGEVEPHGRFEVSGKDRLRVAREAVEDALLVPAADRTWLATMTSAVDTLCAAFCRHRDVSEAPGGPLDQAVRRRPELARAATRQRHEHEQILDDIDSVIAALAATEASAADPEDLRWRVGRLQESVRRHMAKGSDLLYEAFVRDEGGEG